MNIESFIPTTSQQAAVLLESNQFEINVLYFDQRKEFVIGLKNLEKDQITHAISYKQRSVEGRAAEVKLFKSFPVKDLIKLKYLSVRFDVVM